jgi:hypothetical protein
MIQRATADLAELYETDETAWLEAMAELIQQGHLGDLDYAHLAEYLGDMARRDRKEVKSRLITLLAHLLKWVHQPNHRTHSWRGTIIEQRQELAEDAARGVLRNHAEEVLADAYAKAIERAAGETGLAVGTFPGECPYTVDQLLSADFLSELPEFPK